MADNGTDIKNENYFKYLKKQMKRAQKMKFPSDFFTFVLRIYT